MKLKNIEAIQKHTKAKFIQLEEEKKLEER